MEPKPETLSRVLRLAARDPFAQSLGIECVDGGPGRAAVRIRVKERHLNFNGTCHGGVIFALADTAFGLAANSHGKLAPGIDAHVTYLAAVGRGDLITATATEVSRSRRLAVYRVDVAREDGTLVSTFTGTVYVMDKHNEE
jgi:acyl-CoA thioesterase